MRKRTKTQAFHHSSHWLASVFSVGLLLLLGCACSMPSPPTGITSIGKPRVTLTKVPTIASTPTASPAGWDTDTSSNWSGYTFPQGGITGVQAQWTEPDVSKVPNGHVATWLGIGGWAESYNNIVQIGTLAYVDSNGQVQHTVWYETLPPNSWIWIGSISAHDKVFASIQLEKANVQTWDLLLIDNTQHQTFKVKAVFSSQRIYADFIVEDADATSNNGPPFYPFPHFSPVMFSHTEVRYSHDWMSVDAVRGLQVTLVQSGVVLARPGPLKNGTFAVVRVGS